MSLLALLTLIRNSSVDFVDSSGDKLSWDQFIAENGLLLIVLGACMMWVLLAAAYYVSFAAFKWSDVESGYEIVGVEEQEGAGLNFFLTLIVPLVIDDVGTVQGCLSFTLVIAIICCLLHKTNLFYANPILAVLGYRVYEFSFKSNKNYGGTKCIGLCKGIVREGQTVEYKIITEKVLYIKGM